jgi:hypothetical protein
MTSPEAGAMTGVPDAASPRRKRAPRLSVRAVLDPDAHRVEVGGQLFDAANIPVVGADVVIRSSWGIECTTRSTALGSFGARFSAPDDVAGHEVAIEVDGLIERVQVR